METNLVLAEVDRLIAAAEEHIEQQRRYVRTVAAERLRGGGPIRVNGW
jgi:hypothetical protein